MGFKSVVSYWFLPLGIKNSAKKIISQNKLSYLFNSEKIAIKRLAKNNQKFRNLHQGKRCFILGTGPSVKSQNLFSLKDELTIAVSQFFLHKDIKIVKPKYHVLAPTHSPFNFNDLNKIFTALDKVYTDETKLFLGYRPYIYSIKNFLDEHPKFGRKNQFFIDYSNSPEINEENHAKPILWNIDQNPFQIRTVIYSAIQVALYMGCKSIYLVGCDHDYLNDVNRISNHHFYQEEDGISDVEHLSSFNTERWFKEYYFRWRDYRLIKQFASSNGCSIFNATQGGMLDVFPRVDLDRIV